MTKHKMKSLEAIYLKALIICILLFCFNYEEGSTSYAKQSQSKLPKTNSENFEIAKVGYRYRFPEDHMSHPQFATEWWYYTGNLSSEGKSQQFGYQLTFFRTGLKPNGESIYFAHFTLTDVKGKKFYFSELINRPFLNMAGVTNTTSSSSKGLLVQADKKESVYVWNKNWSTEIKSTGEVHRLKAEFEDNKIDLTLTTKAPAVIQGHPTEGISRKGSCESCASHYYSYPQLNTTGSLFIRGNEYKVNGQSWMDHEFGSSQLQKNQVGWDWLGLQMNDGSSLMLYRMREVNGKTSAFSSGSYVSRDGQIIHLEKSDFLMKPTKYWPSHKSKAVYPLVWEITVFPLDLGIKILPKALDQELHSFKGLKNHEINYWEGAIQAIDRTTGKSIGQGYLELTGYDQQLGRL